MPKYEELKEPSEEDKMVLEVATNRLSWAQELNTMSFPHANFITVENGEDAAPHYRGYYEFPNLGLEIQS